MVTVFVSIVNLAKRRLCSLPVIICKNQQVVDKTNLFVLKFIRCFRHLLTTEDAVLVNRKLLINHICERRSQRHIERVTNKRSDGFTFLGVSKNILPVRTYLARSGRRIRDEVCICITPVIKAHSISKCHREFFAVIKIDSNFQKCGVIPQTFLFLNRDNLAELKQPHLLLELILLGCVHRLQRERETRLANLAELYVTRFQKFIRQVDFFLGCGFFQNGNIIVGVITLNPVAVKLSEKTGCTCKIRENIQTRRNCIKLSRYRINACLKRCVSSVE